MDWEQHFCPNQDCSVDFWLAQQSSEHHELWQLRDRYGNSAFTIAAAVPVCPGCGSTLCLIVDLAEHNRAVLESEQMREFVRNLR
jgi:hypothetical protein